MSVVRLIFTLDILFILLCSPWHVIRARKAYGGLGRNGAICVGLVNYSELVALVFHVITPIIIYRYVGV